MIYGAIWVIALVLLWLTSQTEWLALPAIAYAVFAVWEVATYVKKQTRRQEAFCRSLSELRNMVIDCAKDDNAKLSIGHGINPIEFNVKTLGRIICECFREYNPTKVNDVKAIVAIADDMEMVQKHKLTWVQLLHDLANYLVVERDRIDISKAKKKLIKTQDKELPDA